MSKTAIIAGLILLFLTGAFIYFRWSSQIRQPLDFSHGQHIKQQIECAACHKSLNALPVTATCRPCHPQFSTTQTVQWIRVYRIAPDVIFTHDRHSDISCETCHKAMTTPRRWIHESRFTMDFCMKCHAERGAPNECRTCHKNR
jgi:class III cytochrome C family protein